MGDLDIDNMCRLCCEKKGRLRSLFEQTAKNGSLSLQQIILDVTRLEVGPGDGMPQKICRTCTNTLMKMHETIEGYRTNDLRIRQQLGWTHLPLVEIKEEEVDIDVLQQSCQQDMMVENICIKQEVEEEHLDEFGQVEGGKVEIKSAEGDKSETDEADEAEQDDDWKPPEVDDEEKPIKSKKAPKKVRKPRRKRDPNEPPKIPGKRIRKHPHPDRPRFQDFKCYVCMSDSLGSIEGVLAHLNDCHKDMLPYTCKECVKETIVIKTLLSLNNHHRQHHNPEQCPHCDRRYTSKNNVTLHIQMYHTGENEPSPSPCEICGKTYPTKLALKNHMRLHTSGAACEICGKIFLERSKLRRHIQNRHEKLKKFECFVCHKMFSSISAVQIHNKTYHSTQLFKCSYCPKSFHSDMTHRLHEKKHVDNPNYEPTKDWQQYYTVLDGDEVKVSKLKKCNLCGFETRNMGTHLSKVHFPTEYRCEICGATFKYKPTFVAHVDEHKHGKAFKCPICGKEFTERRNLISHLRTKQHRDHPLAQQMLGTIKTANSTKSDGGNSDVDVDESQEESRDESELALSSII